MITTRWSDTHNNKIDEVMELISVKPKDDLNEETVSYVNWNVEKMLDVNEKLIINGKEVLFNCINYSYDQIIPGEEPEEHRTSKYDGFVIIYQNDEKVNYIINRNSDALRIIRQLLKYRGKKEVVKSTFNFKEDFFIWLISKIYKRENIIEALNEDVNEVNLDMIKSFKGNTEGLLNKITAEGESVINIISTLSFLLESGNINNIVLELGYGNHKCILLEFNGCGEKLTISTDRESYMGSFENKGENLELVLHKLMLLLYLEIIPILVQSYQSDIQNEEWNKKKKISFLEKVAEELSDRVKRRVEDLNSEKEIQFNNN